VPFLRGWSLGVSTDRCAQFLNRNVLCYSNFDLGRFSKSYITPLVVALGLRIFHKLN
jgi:hypothetical protein